MFLLGFLLVGQLLLELEDGRLLDRLGLFLQVDLDQGVVNQAIHVGRSAHKPIVLGKGGQTLKAIGAAARADMAVAFDRPVHLFLFVRVTEGWADDPEHYRTMGLEFPK